MEAFFDDLSTSQTLKDKAYKNLRDLIITGKIKPGSRLVEEELAKQMNISRGPIREALNMLGQQGFAVIVPRKGAFVSEVTSELVRDIWELRAVLEPFAAKSSVDLIPESSIERVEKMLQKSRSRPNDFNTYIKSDLGLHEMLYAHKENRYFKDFMLTTAGHSLRVRYVAENNEKRKADTILRVYREHQIILDAVKRRDPLDVYSAVSEHIQNGMERCLSALNVEI